MKTILYSVSLLFIGITLNIHAQAPVASFTSSTVKCSGQTVLFIDLSSNSPTAWNWSFPGANPSSSSAQNPTVIYPAAGIYTITMFASVTNFTGTPISQTIAVAPSPTLSIISAPQQSPCPWESATLSATGANTYTWYPGPLTGSTVSVPWQSTATYTLIASIGSCNTSTTTLLIINPTPILLPSGSIDYFCSGETSASIMILPFPATTYSWSNGFLGSTLIVSPPVNQTFTCYIKGNNVCMTRIAQLMMAPDATLTVSSGTICAGSPATLCVNSTVPMTFTWIPTLGLTNNAGPWACVAANPPTTTNYTVIGEEILPPTKPCPGAATLTITVRPSPTLVTTSVTICAGESQSICVTGANSYTWSNIFGLSSYAISCPVASPSLTTTYSVSGTGPNGCTKSASSKVLVDPCNGLGENKEVENVFEIFPNPNSGIFSIKTEVPGTEFVLYNAVGEKVYSCVLQSGMNPLELKTTKGIYYARIIYSNSITRVKKIVIE